jgi:hypothetical protein
MFIVVSTAGNVYRGAFPDAASANSYRDAINAAQAAEPKSAYVSAEVWSTMEVAPTETQTFFPWFEGKVFKGEYDNKFYFQEQTITGLALHSSANVSAGVVRDVKDYLGNPVILVSAGSEQELRTLGQAAADELNAK